MFNDCISLENVTNFDGSSLYGGHGLYGMFRYCTNLSNLKIKFDLGDELMKYKDELMKDEDEYHEKQKEMISKIEKTGDTEVGILFAIFKWEHVFEECNSIGSSSVGITEDGWLYFKK